MKTPNNMSKTFISRVEKELGDGRVICERCGATLATYAEFCSAPLEEQCPGYVTIEKVRSLPPEEPL